jgi:hypothetical protein
MALDDRQDRYPFPEIEARWQKVWADRKQFKVTEEPGRPKYYCLEMFPYPSGRIHMGHVRVYAIGDLLARYKWMRGFNVLHPMGWDAFGLPAENAAIDNGVHPAVWTYENIDNMRTQLRRMGISYDWDREVATCDPAYYKWEQLVFIRMLERGWAYRRLVLQDHRVRAGAARLVRSPAGLARAGAHHAAQLDRAQRGRRVRAAGGRATRRDHPHLHHPPGHLLRHDLRGARARAPSGRHPRRRR